MEKFREFSKKYCIKELLLIFIVSLFMFFLFYAKQDVYLVDVGREAYVPWQMLKGQLLYKDIFNVYGPLGYQINALAYFIFGINLNTLYWAGFINSIVILFTVFYISKLFVNKIVSLSISGLILFVCVFAKNFFNFIFTYSYNAVYALSGFLLSLLFGLHYIKSRKTKDLILAFLFAGFSFANKIEDLPYFCLLFLVLPFWLKKDWKKYLYALAAFFFFPLISFGIILLQGVSIKDIFDSAILIKKLVNAPATNYFYYHYGLYFNPFVVQKVLLIFFKFLKHLLLLFFVLFALNFINIKYIEKRSVKYLVNTFGVLFIIYFTIKNFDKIFIYYDSIFCWLGMACLLIFALMLFYFAHKIFKQKLQLKDIPIDEKMFIFLLTASLSVSAKGLFDVVITCYGTFIMTAMLIPFIIYTVKYLPVKLNCDIKKTLVVTVCYFCLFAMIACLFFNVSRIFNMKMYILNTPQGKLAVRDIYPYQNELITYLREKTPKDAKIVTIPEGVIINFLSQRDSDNMYYYLIPVNIDIFGEERILNDFKKDPPDYFLMNNLSYNVYNTGNFCEYASKICDFINAEYKPEVTADGVIKMILYKKR